MRASNYNRNTKRYSKQKPINLKNFIIDTDSIQNQKNKNLIITNQSIGIIPVDNMNETVQDITQIETRKNSTELEAEEK